MTNLREICKERLVDSVFNRMSPKRDRLGRYIYLVPIGKLLFIFHVINSIFNLDL